MAGIFWVRRSAPSAKRPISAAPCTSESEAACVLCAQSATSSLQSIENLHDKHSVLTPAGGHRSFLEAAIRERLVAEDWLVSIDANWYSLPFALNDKSVQVTRESADWVIV